MNDIRKEFWNCVDKAIHQNSKSSPKRNTFSRLDEKNDYKTTKQIVEANQKNSAVICEEIPDNQTSIANFK
jgi:hypothetical protein